MRKDLTFSKNFTDFLGAFWSAIFDQGALGGAIGGYSSEQLIQVYVDMVEMVNYTAIDTAPIFHRENLYPVRIKKSELLSAGDIPVYGGGGYFGDQPEESIYREGSTLLYGEPARLENPYYIDTNDESLKNLGAVGLNRLFEPSVVLANNSDFFLRDGVIYFRNNPFDNELFPKRVIDGSGDEQDEEIVVWFCDVDIEKFNLYKQFGFIFTNYKDSSQLYKDIIIFVFKLVSKGSSLAQIESFLAAITGSPITREVTETIEQIKTTPEGLLVITDKNVYTINATDTLRDDIVVGVVLPAGSPLTDTVEVVDTRNPEWWKDFEALPLSRGAMSDDVPFISFPNTYETAQYGPEIIENNLDSKRVRFSLIGAADSVTRFWKGVDSRSKESLLFAGKELFKKYGIYEEEDDYYEYPPFLVNPAQIFANDLVNGAILPIRIKLSSVRDVDAFFGTISVLKQCSPVYLMIYLFISDEVLDTFDLQRTDSQGITLTTTTPVDLQELFNFNFTGDLQDAWEDTDDDGEYLCKVPEALAFSISPGNLLEQFDLSDQDNVVDNIHLKQRKKCSI